MKRQKTLAVPFLMLGCLTLAAGFFVLKGIGTRASTLNKLPGHLSSDSGLFEQYGLSTNELDGMIQSAGSFGGGWDFLAFMLLIVLGVFEIFVSLVCLFGKQAKNLGN
tara:strand:- start:63950 stop:64273 length:324 start_codon:yes stop_codon:yes gene_type:complete